MKSIPFRNILISICLGCLASSLALAQSTYGPYTFTTIAGQAGASGSADGTGSAAQFVNPGHVAVDSAGNVFVAEYGNNTIRKVAPDGTNWIVSTVAGGPKPHGTADGLGTDARFWSPVGVAVDSADNVYVTDVGNHTIRKLTPVGTNWVVTTLAGLAGVSGSADGIGSAARFRFPTALTVDSAGNVYVACQWDNTIRKVTPVGTNWVVMTLAGLARNYGSADGTGSAARFGTSKAGSGPCGVAVDSAGL